MTKLPPYTIIIDTREQLPFDFGEVHTVRKKLDQGDYSLLGYENQVAIERKSLGDLFTSLTRDRVRFEKEIQRLCDYEFSAVVCEADFAAVRDPYFYDVYWRNRANANSIIGSILSWSIRYPTRWVLCPDRPFAERITADLFRLYLKNKDSEISGDAKKQ